ncbi:MAG: hypothetical protein ACI80V_002063 [Rhodothermales bacterium]|jgi:hypothetical protein
MGAWFFVENRPPSRFLLRMSPRLLVLLAFFFVAEGSSAQFSGEESNESVPVMSASRMIGSMDLDGRLEEADWQGAQSIGEFRQSEPSEGGAPSQETQVRVLYDQGYIYVGAKLYDDDARNIERRLGRRDELNRADWFIVSLDSYLDRKTAFVFGVSAAGVQYDALDKGSGMRGPDRSWDAIWASSVQIEEDGWSVEMRIPYSMLRFAAAESQTWGVHFERKMPRRGEDVEWPHVPRADQANKIARFSLLTGLDNISPRSNIQVSPYTVSRLQTAESSVTPGGIDRSGSFDIGGDVKMGLGSSVILDATINPDFGQVEADPAQLNLTAFETFNQERRPFFVEGAQLFDFSMGHGGGLLYSRRIGAASPIVGATKLSGRTANGLSFGVLGATTGDKFTPDRSFGVLRMSQQIGDFSSLGGILTATDKPDTDGRHRSVVGGTDWDVRLGNNQFSLTGFAVVTQRMPAALGVSNQTGMAGSVRAARRQGTWRYNLTGSVFDDQFNPNDLGRFTRNNYTSVDGGLSRDFTGVPGTQRVEFNIFGGQSWSYTDGRNLGSNVFLRLRANTNRFQRIGLDVSVDNPFGGYDLFETRGLGPRAEPASLSLHTEFHTDERNSWRARNDLRLEVMDDGGVQYSVGLEGNLSVGSRLTLKAEVDTKWERNVVAWSSNESFLLGGGSWQIGSENTSPDNLAPEDYVPFDDLGVLGQLAGSVDPYDEDGAYYLPVFGARDTRSMDFTLRSGITFTKSLSIQIYGQMFVAQGRYQDFRVLQDADTFTDLAAHPKRDEFSFGRLQANTVLRWEYRPGSTLYLVWTQARRNDDELNPLSPDPRSPFDNRVTDQLSSTFDMIPSNAFQVKLNYTFLR